MQAQYVEESTTYEVGFWQDQLTGLGARARVACFLALVAYEADFPLTIPKWNRATGDLTHFGTIFFFSGQGEKLGILQEHPRNAEFPETTFPKMSAGTKLAFECAMDSALCSNNEAEVLQFFLFRVRLVSPDGSVVSLYPDLVISIRGSFLIRDFFTEFVPADTLHKSISYAVPQELLRLCPVFYANQAIKAIRILGVLRGTGWSPFAPRDQPHDDTQQAAQPVRVTVTGHSYGGAIANILAMALVNSHVIIGAPALRTDTFAFGSPPYVNAGEVPSEEPELEAGPATSERVIIRNFINADDGVPSLRLPNVSGTPQPLFVLPAGKPNERLFYLGKDDTVQEVQAYSKAKAEQGGDAAGLPWWLTFNNDHSAKDSYLARMNMETVWARLDAEATQPLKSMSTYCNTPVNAAKAIVTQLFSGRTSSPTPLAQLQRKFPLLSSAIPPSGILAQLKFIAASFAI